MVFVDFSFIPSVNQKQHPPWSVFPHLHPTPKDPNCVLKQLPGPSHATFSVLRQFQIIWSSDHDYQFGLAKSGQSTLEGPSFKSLEY